MAQHYVPRFILKNFNCGRKGKKPQVWVFDKHTGNKFRSNIENVAAENSFYDFNFEGIELTVEQTLSESGISTTRYTEYGCAYIMEYAMLFPFTRKYTLEY